MSEGLSGLRMVEVGGGVAAPAAGKLLADLGAEVVKVEPPQGEPGRHRGPFPGGRADPEASGTFTFLNANKRSVTADLSGETGRERLAALAARAHLVVHDLAPRAMAAAGLEFERLTAASPGLVLVSITPFGLTGPHRDYAADDMVLTHAGGWGWLCPGNGTPAHKPPIKPFGRHALVHAGLHAAVAGLAACLGAAASGRGEHVDVSVQEVVALLIGRHFSYPAYTGRPESYRSPTPYEPYSFYPTRDGHIYIICPEQAQWERLVEVMGRPGWALDERFATRPGRQAHAAEIKARLSEWTAQHDAAGLYHAWQRVRVGAAPVYTFPEIEAEPHLEARRFFAAQPRAQGGSLKVPGAPYKLRRDWWALRTPAPRVGEADGEAGGLLAPGTAEAAQDGRGGNGSRAGAADGGALPLAGVRVLDLSWVWAGPHCTQLLAFLGAEVIKVENANRLDLTRRSHIFPADMEPGINRCGYFNAINQDKLSVGLDLARPEGLEVARALAAKSDVMVSNFGTGVLEKLGLGPEVVQAANPELIVAMISAFGQTGPCRGYSGYGPLIAPLAGLSAQTGYAEDGLPEDVGIAYGDPNSGVYAAFAILAALWARRPGTPGQVIDVSMWEAMLCTGFEGWMNHALGNAPWRPMGNRDPVDAPHNVYRCAGEDCWVAVAVRNAAQWRALCEVVGRPDWAADPALAEAPGRKAREDELDAGLAEWCARHDRWQATQRLQAAGVAAFPSMTAQDLVDDPHLHARGCLTRHPHPEVGVRTLMGAPWRLTHRPNGRGKAAPVLGADGDDVLARLLDMDAAERARLREVGALQ